MALLRHVRHALSPAVLLVAACGGETEIIDPDTTPPTAVITFPLPGSILAGEVLIQATAADDRAVAGVQFLLDEVPFGAEVTSVPYNLAWETTGVPDGPHELVAVARDASDNTRRSQIARFTVLNSPPPGVGVIGVWTMTSGPGTDPDGYSVTLDDQPVATIGVNANIEIPGVPEGTHSVNLTNVSPLCSVSGGTLRSVQVPPNGTGTVVYDISCEAPPT
ncbi:MAG TPA: Ig-like domain-containing protein [Gemmatimonadales bacterium]